MLVVVTLYVAIMLLVWPRADATAGLPLKITLALSPVVPVAWLVWLMARRVMHSDELEQRLHLLALGIATAAVGTLSMVGGFLAAAHIWSVGGAVLIWVFPLLCVAYDIARALLKRHYTGSSGWC
jgi:hypothetical protein